jgi:hypothetical protein
VTSDTSIALGKIKASLAANCSDKDGELVVLLERYGQLTKPTKARATKEKRNKGKAAFLVSGALLSADDINILNKVN